MQASQRTSTRGRSAQAVDPLSWFVGPLAPLAFGAIIVVVGPLLVFAGYADGAVIAVQLAAVLVCSSACVLAHIATRPRRPPIGWTVSVLILLISLCGCLLSGLNNGPDGQSVEQWWASGAVGLAIASLAPYLPVRRLVVLGLATTAVVGVIGAVTFPAGSGVWSVSGVVVVVVTAPLLGLAASSFFSVFVVRTVQRMLAERDSAPDDGGQGELAVQDAAQRTERDTLAMLTARVTPFLTRLAETGSVTAADRAIAGQLARRLRDDLVSRTNASWLDALAAGRPVVVMDPENRADAMNDAQKLALTGLITAILDTPDATSAAVLVELRGQKNGATAVGVSMDISLPEGRRTMHLAPYYLTLKTAFEGLSWSDRHLMHMHFEGSRDPGKGGTV